MRFLQSAPVATLLILVASCETPKVALGDSARTTKPAMTVPFAVGEPTDGGPVRATLARFGWVVVDDGDNGLRTAIRKPGPAMLTHFVDDSRPILYNRLHRLTYGGHSVRYGEALEVDEDELEALGFVPPAEWVWLFGGAGPCRARVGPPRVGRADRASRTFEISYALLDCDVVASKWAPVGSVAETLPPDVFWVAAVSTDDFPFSAEEGWDHPLAAAAELPEVEGVPTRYVAHARTVEIDGAPSQAVVSAVFESAEDRCADVQVHRVTAGWWDGRTLARWDEPWADAVDPPLLIGALARDGEAQALVFADGLDGLVAVTPAERPELAEGEVMQIDPGPDSWTVAALARGLWSDQERADATFSVLPECRR